jgi:CRP-like cAMP-binding protein
MQLLQDRHVETNTLTAPLMRESELAPRDAPGRRRRTQADEMIAVRGAWQAVLGPTPLAPELLDQLLLLSNVTDVGAGKQVFSRQEPARGFLLLVQGDVGMGAQEPHAAFHLERSVRAPAWLDLSSGWLGRTHAQDAVAFGAARVVNVSRSAFQTLMQRHPDLARRVVQCLAQQVYTLTGATHDLMHKDAQARFAAWLLERCASTTMAPNRSRVVLRERKRDIASQLAITPETLSRLLRQFRADGLLEVHGYTIEVLDSDALRERAEP